MVTVTLNTVREDIERTLQWFIVGQCILFIAVSVVKLNNVTEGIIAKATGLVKYRLLITCIIVVASYISR